MDSPLVDRKQKRHMYWYQMIDMDQWDNGIQPDKSTLRFHAHHHHNICKLSFWRGRWTEEKIPEKAPTETVYAPPLPLSSQPKMNRRLFWKRWEHEDSRLGLLQMDKRIHRILPC